MAKILKDQPLPKGIMRLLNSVPILFYKCGLGFVFGKRFLMLTHIGRKSDLAHDTVLEVVKSDEYSKRYYVASGWGEKSNWFQNIIINPEVKIQVRNEEVNALLKRLELEQAIEVLLEYANIYPKAFSILFN